MWGPQHYGHRMKTLYLVVFLFYRKYVLKCDFFLFPLSVVCMCVRILLLLVWGHAWRTREHRPTTPLTEAGLSVWFRVTICLLNLASLLWATSCLTLQHRDLADMPTQHSVDSGDQNSGSCVFRASTLSIEPSPNGNFFVLIHVLNCHMEITNSTTLQLGPYYVINID